MSQINVFIVKDDNVHFVSLPYKQALNFIEQGVNGLLSFLNASFLDAGYLTIDINRKVILNGQHAFPLSRQLREKFDVYEA